MLNEDTFATRIVVGGPPRTGSTLLRFMLDRHPAIVAPPETNFFTFPLEHNRSRRVAYLSRKLSQPEEEIRVALSKGRDELAVFDFLMAQVSGREGKRARAWAEKSPPNCLHYQRLNQKFNNLRFISIIRHGLDVVTSRHARRPGSGYHCSIQNWMESTEAVLSFVARNHLVVRYEDLVQGPEKEIVKIMAWLEMDYLPSMLDHLHDGYGNRDFKLVNQPKLREPINPKWVRRYNSEVHSQRVEEFLSTPGALNLLERSGYGV